MNEQVLTQKSKKKLKKGTFRIFFTKNCQFFCIKTPYSIINSRQIISENSSFRSEVNQDYKQKICQGGKQFFLRYHNFLTL